MPVNRHGFTETIQDILNSHFGDSAVTVFERSELIQYLNIKTRAANRGSKSRAGFANHYAIYVLIEDYLNGGFHENNLYENYERARFSDLFNRQRELPFGSKLQNYALNHRLNQEFIKYFPTCEYTPIIRDSSTNRYWVNEKFLKVEVGSRTFKTGEAIKEIIDAYVSTRLATFNAFIIYWKQMIRIQEKDPSQAIEFIRGLVQPNVDARVFEIVSYGILKENYADQAMFWGWSRDELTEESLILYKTGRTNANDGGVDFVMRVFGRFFQVTETIDAGEYF